MLNRESSLLRTKGKTASHQPDKLLIGALLILLVFGLMMLFSASWVVSYDKFGNTYHYFFRQFIWVLVSLGAFYLVSKIDYRWLKKFAFLFLLLSIFLLILVFIPGLRAEHGTSRSWIVIFGQSFQPAELVKLSFLIYLATWLESRRGELKDFWSGTFPFLVTLAIVSGLMIAQPDLGTLLIIIFSAIATFFIGGGRVTHLLIIGLIGVAGLLAILSFKGNYQTDRLHCYRDPSYSRQAECYQINQALIAVGSGGWLGRGIGESRQKYLYLPEVWGDAIFPIIAEEIGFIFSSLLILLYLFIFYRGLMIAKQAPDSYGSLLAVGIVAWLAFQTFLNIGGMTNLIPMTGVPLPFISAGGSAILANLMAMGILINISKQTKPTKTYKQRV
ncbi:MAG: putative lipid II flippase FtsW [Patescibacteria group bacterium]|jgi:cell division protein FtsW